MLTELSSLWPRSIGSMRPLTNFTSLLSLNAVLKNSSTTHLTPKPDISPYGPPIPLNDLVYAKVKDIWNRYPLFSFRELQVTSIRGPTPSPELLLDVRLLFSGGDGSMYVDMTSRWGKWGQIRFSDAPFPEGNNILPTRLGMDIVFADALMKRAGYLGSYLGLIAKWPMGLRMGSDQPFYCFLMEADDPAIVYVGMNTQTVMTELPMGGGGLDSNDLTIV